jgi:hypothetical protein
MVRGINQEFNLQEKLCDILNLIDKDGQEDYDLANKEGEFESKLAATNSAKHTLEGTYIKIKCMRSRTIGDKVAESRSKQLKIAKEVLLLHGDQYTVRDFKFLVVTLENAFCEKGVPRDLNNKDREFFKNIGIEHTSDLASIPFFCFSQDIISTKENPVCKRRKCDGNCGFIPNHPIMFFPKGSPIPEHPWKSTESFLKLLQSLGYRNSYALANN